MAAVLRSPSRMYRHRPVLVAADLADLHGPTKGLVTLPLHVFWSADPVREWDLDDEDNRRELYRTVVREAKRATDLDVLDGETLISLWPDMCLHILPPQVQGAWEDRHPALATARPAADRLRAAS